MSNEAVTIKTLQEIEILRQGGKILAQVLRAVGKQAKAGVITKDLDDLAEKLIRQAGGEPAFKGFAEKSMPPFPTTLCTSLNDEVVHAPAVPGRTLKDGDLLKLDIGMRWPCRQVESYKVHKVENGLYTDMAMTVPVGKVSREAQGLMKVTREALMAGIKQVRPGKHTSDIGKAIQEYAEKYGFSVVRDLVGHGVGYAVHEAPEVPNFWQAGMHDCELKTGMVICLEPMVNIGACQVSFSDDGWTVCTSDCSLSAHFEHTVIVTDKGAIIATE